MQYPIAGRCAVWKCLVMSVFLFGAGSSRAQQSTGELPQHYTGELPRQSTVDLHQQSMEELRKLFELQNQQLEEMKRRLDAVDKKAEDKKAEEEAKWVEIGKVMNVTAKFNEFGYLWLNTPNSDFTMHPGMWMQYDNVFWTQTPGLRTPPDGRPGPKQGVASGVAMGGIGNLQDGTFFRRVRPFVEGTVWENTEYRLILALENVQFSATGFDEFWVGQNNIPLIGTVRVGHVKSAQGLEGDMTASSRAMTFMERSSYSEAIEENENFVTGIWASNSFFDQHATYTAVVARQDQTAASGAFFGDGQWGWHGRLTALPWYLAEGRHFLHLGLSGGWLTGANNLAVSPFRTFQLRARPELRDDNPAGSPAGTQTIPNANSNRMVDTGVIAASNQWSMGLELLYVLGPFSVQGEYGSVWFNNAIGINPSGLTLNPALIPPQNYVFNGGYVQLSYILTGESRNYDRKWGIIAREYLKGGPRTNAWLVRDECGHCTWGWGAWEIAGRYSYVNLNDGNGLNRIQGGVMNGVSVALNWYLNTNTSWMFDWVYDQRSALPPGAIPGFTSGFGARCQISF